MGVKGRKEKGDGKTGKKKGSGKYKKERKTEVRMRKMTERLPRKE